MEDHAVIKAFAGQFRDAGDMAGRQVRAQADNNVTAGVIAGVEREGEGLFSHTGSFCRGGVIAAERVGRYVGCHE